MISSIFFLESSINLGGQEYQILTQMVELQKRSWKPYLFCKKTSKIGEIASKNDLDVVHVSFRNALDILSILIILKNLIRIKPRAIVLHSGHDANIGAISAICYRALIRNKIFIIRSRTYQPGIPKSFSYNKLFDITLTPSEYLRNQLLENKKIIPTKVKVLYPGINFEELSKNIDEPYTKEIELKICSKSGPFILHGAMLRGEKGHLQFLKVFARLLKINPSLQYIIAGDGPERQSLEREVNRLGINNNVIFTGIINPISPLFKRADFAILPSHREPLGMFQIESQYFEIPTIASKVDGVPETIKNHETGLLTTNSEDDWFAAMEWALHNHIQMSRYAKNGKNFVVNKFSIKNNIDFLINLIKNYNHSN